MYKSEAVAAITGSRHMGRIFSYGTILLFTVTTTKAVYAESSFDFYGHLNFGIFNVDDGAESETYFTDNDVSNTRVGFNWANDLGEGRGLRFNFETGVGLNGSSAVTIDDTDLEFQWDKRELRKFELIYKTPDIGTFSFGQGSTASDGVAEADLSGTGVVAYSGIADLGGNIGFRDDADALTGVTINGAFNNFDGGGRRFRLRYDTPSFQGLVFSVSAGQEVLKSGDDNEYYNAGAKYTADYGDIKVDGRVGYSWVSGEDGLLAGSVAGLHVPTGLSIALSTGARQDDGEADYYYIKLGWEQQWLDAGTTALSVDYTDGSDYVFDGSDSESLGVAVVQNVDTYNLEIYASYRSFEFDSSGTEYQDIDLFVVGARWKF